MSGDEEIKRARKRKRSSNAHNAKRVKTSHNDDVSSTIKSELPTSQVDAPDVADADMKDQNPEGVPVTQEGLSGQPAESGEKRKRKRAKKDKSFTKNREEREQVVRGEKPKKEKPKKEEAAVAEVEQPEKLEKPEQPEKLSKRQKKNLKKQGILPPPKEYMQKEGTTDQADGEPEAETLRETKAVDTDAEQQSKPKKSRTKKSRKSKKVASKADLQGEGEADEANVAPEAAKPEGQSEAEKTEIEPEAGNLGEGEETAVVVTEADETEMKERKRRRRFRTPKSERSNPNDSTSTAVILSHSSNADNAPQRVLKAHWEISQPAGGRFLDVDPVFSPNEKYIILALDKTVNVYATATSLLVSSLPTPKSSTVSSYALSTVNPKHLYVISNAQSQSVITLWDWQNAKQVGQWVIDSTSNAFITDISTSCEEGSSDDTVYTLGRYKAEKNEISFRLMAYQFSPTAEDSKQTVTVHDSKEELVGLQVLAEGKIVLTATSKGLRIGSLERRKEGALNGLNYGWREVTSSEPIACFHGRVRIEDQDVKSEASNAKPKSHGDQHLDVVVGGALGVVYVYEDVLHTVLNMTRHHVLKGKPFDLQPRALHWHREAVGATKWSRDGNYIISGGQETVLCIWQVETGRRQDLPHLTAAIDGLVVSPKGASYAVRLADNSVIVLSTSELEPTAVIAGLQIQPVSIIADPEMALVRTVNNKGQDKAPTDTVRRTPASLLGTQLLAAVPSSVSRANVNNQHLPAPYLQAYDILQDRHVYRQAITRNNATIFVNNPEGKRIREPDVRFVEVSNDGKWLATVEEWKPPKSDLAFLAPNTEGVVDELQSRMESYLKFWSWNEERDGGVWELETRIDSPHLLADGLSAGRVFSLIAEPNGTGFATIGNDSVVRVWKPKTRLRDGTVVRGVNGEGLVTWSARHTVQLDTHPAVSELEFEFPSESQPKYACLAYSQDGSLLVASQVQSNKTIPPLVHFINANAGEVAHSRAGLCSSDLIALSIIDRCLVTLSDSVSVWDMVTEEHIFGFKLEETKNHQLRRLRTEVNHLSVNATDGTFAMSIASRSKGNETSFHSTICVFSPGSPNPIWRADIEDVVTALLPVRGAKGYVAVTCAGKVRVVGPDGATLQALPEFSTALTIKAQGEAAGVITQDATNANEDADVADGALVPAGDAMDIDGDDQVDADKSVVRPQQLAKIFDVGPSFALPPVRDLFGAVVQLYARKPRREVAAAA